MAVLDLTTGLSDAGHAFRPELIELCKRSRLVIAFLVSSREKFILVSNHIILELAHSVERHAGSLGKLP